ncbi:murein transglycosylase A [Hoeflea prorocentri]|uniref:peptidoglycan lytic exotransglycosylase n=1 Tax=Hoeflea prorocentri TaxID=1922333 RepID=A0A9X3ZIQ0_9HYPH|nr:murein transglycosylase A [Hoeflea prorocentri]MCY6383157.1 murein transglycosylase A [Hoeflea prorocentri]MDA5400957.1 murein transglycosylase A [Hoeflea prorocentri]
MQADLSPVSYDDLPDWSHDDPRDVLTGFLDCADHAQTVKPHKTGSLGLQWSDFVPASQILRKSSVQDAAEARGFLERHFTPFKVVPRDGSGGVVTAYYEPEVGVARERSGPYRFAFHKRPDDLVALDMKTRPKAMDPGFAYGRRTDGAVCEYPDRAAIESGFLDGHGLEIAWARDRIDVFFAHIQGAARLRYADGTVERITYAAKTGHPFTAIGRVLIAMGEQDPETVSMQSLRTWLAENPERLDEILWQNRSYIFFRTAPVADPDRGPVAAAKVPLIAGRSLAVDKHIHTFGTPVFVQADDLTHLTDGPFRRLMIAQDTGSAIVGPARGDIFTGSGAAAGEQAGTVRNDAVFFVLVPNEAAGRVGP